MEIRKINAHYCSLTGSTKKKKKNPKAANVVNGVTKINSSLKYKEPRGLRLLPHNLAKVVLAPSQRPRIGLASVSILFGFSIIFGKSQQN